VSLEDIIASRNSALTVEEVAQFLSVSQRLIYQLVSKGDIPHFRVGAAVRFEPKRLGAWLELKMSDWQEQKIKSKPASTRAYIEDPRLHAEGDQTALWENILLGD
jgi:excisionase family DNA binding protein